MSTIAVRFSRISAAAMFAERFGDMLGREPPAAVIYVVALEREAYFWSSPHRARCWPQHINDELLVFFADNVALAEHLTTSADVGLHAAVMANVTSVVALVGASTAGKTTTAVAAVRAGFRFYSDERCIIQQGRVVPFLRAITLREGGRSLLLRDAAASRCAIDARLNELPGQGDCTIRPRRLFGERAGGPPRSLDAIFVIEQLGASPSVERCSLYAALPALLRSMVSREEGLDRAARLMSELRATAIFRLQLGMPAASVSVIERVLHEAFPSGTR